MKTLVLIVLIIIACLIVYWYIKHILKNKVETITAFTGGLGSGKTFLSVQLVRSLYAKNMRKFKFSILKNDIANFFRKNKKSFDYNKPLVYSNIPIIIGYEKRSFIDKLKRKPKKPIYSNVLTKEHLLLQERLNLGSIVFIDEVGSFCSQFDFNQKNVIETCDEFFRLFRHYVSNPALKIQAYMIVNDQCSENINLIIRRRLNMIHNLSNFKILLRHFTFYYERMINISEEIKTIDMKQEETEADSQDNANFKFKFYWSTGRYDAYCYHNRYLNVIKTQNMRYNKLEKRNLMRCPRDKDKRYYPLTNYKEGGID